MTQLSEVKDFLTIVLIVLYLISTIVPMINPRVSRELINETERIEKILEVLK